MESKAMVVLAGCMHMQAAAAPSRPTCSCAQAPRRSSCCGRQVPCLRRHPTPPPRRRQQQQQQQQWMPQSWSVCRAVQSSRHGAGAHGSMVAMQRLSCDRHLGGHRQQQRQHVAAGAAAVRAVPSGLEACTQLQARCLTAAASWWGRAAHRRWCSSRDSRSRGRVQQAALQQTGQQQQQQQQQGVRWHMQPQEQLATQGRKAAPLQWDIQPWQRATASPQLPALQVGPLPRVLQA
jgi:hypothetical protein